MPARFLGLAQKTNGTNTETLSRGTGYRFIRDGHDLLIPDDDEQLNQGPPPVLRTEQKPFSLRNDRDKIAKVYLAEYFTTSLDALVSPVSKLNIELQYGLHSLLKEKKLHFFFARTAAETQKNLQEELFPFMHDEMGAKSVFPIACDITYQQAMLSIHKIGAGIEKFGADHISERLDQNKTFMALLPTVADVCAYPEALLIFSPMAVSLPFGKIASQLHFLRDSLWHFGYLGTQGIFESFASGHNPVPVRTEKDFLGLYELGAYGARKYFTEAIKGVNSLMRWLNDPWQYIGSDGVVNHIKALQAQAAIHLMFADLVAINFTNNMYTKVRHVLAFLDKLANFKIAQRGIRTRNAEACVFHSFFSNTFGQSLASILSYHLSPSYDKLGKCMAKAVANLYEKLDEGENGSDSIIRAIRNTQHGPYLLNEQFQRVFFSDYELPFELSYLPLLMMWGLMLAPDRFLAVE